MNTTPHSTSPTSCAPTENSHLNRLLKRIQQKEARLVHQRERLNHLVKRDEGLRLKSQEQRRRPSLTERAISLSDIVVITKRSKYECDQIELGLNPSELCEHYVREGIAVDRIVSSHNRQHAVAHELAKYLPSEQIVNREQFEQRSSTAKLVIALGGDNHFQWVSHFIRDGLVLPINSDPVSSDGGLMNEAGGALPRVFVKLERGEFWVEEWTRLAACLNGKMLPLAMSEIFIGESERLDMSRYIIHQWDFTEQQKSSGILIATGAGSSGWYDSAIRFLLPHGDRFLRTSREARYISTEPFEGRISTVKKLSGTIAPEGELRLSSLNDHNGVVSTDCQERFNFPRGSELKVSLSDSPLKVVTFDTN